MNGLASVGAALLVLGGLVRIWRLRRVALRGGESSVPTHRPGPLGHMLDHPRSVASDHGDPHATIPIPVVTSSCRPAVAETFSPVRVAPYVVPAHGDVVTRAT